MDYEKEAEELGKITQPEIGTLRDERKKWLRSHDARVLREAAAQFDGEDHSDYHWHDVSDILERRASEIERGEKP